MIFKVVQEMGGKLYPFQKIEFGDINAAQKHLEKMIRRWPGSRFVIGAYSRK